MRSCLLNYRLKLTISVSRLLCCESCSLVFHLDCLEPPLAAVPEDDWCVVVLD